MRQPQKIGISHWLRGMSGMVKSLNPIPTLIALRLTSFDFSQASGTASFLPATGYFVVTMYDASGAVIQGNTMDSVNWSVDLTSIGPGPGSYSFGAMPSDDLGNPAGPEGPRVYFTLVGEE